jgi:glycerophosphoryl diester phosphodiesterase
MPEGDRPLRRVGHKGADLIAPGNTLASFDAALEAGVDMIEFDVLPERGSDRLILAHDYRAAARIESPPTLEEGLAHFASEAFGDVALDVDLKLPGYERRVVDALREFGLLGRAMVSTQYVSSLPILRAEEPGLRLGWSVPRLRRDYTRNPFTALPAYAVLLAYRLRLPGRAARAIRSGRCDALMAHWRLVTPRLVRAVRGAGGDLFVWTVDDLRRIRALGALGVTGVITNDPRLFTALA